MIEDQGSLEFRPTGSTTWNVAATEEQTCVFASSVRGRGDIAVNLVDMQRVVDAWIRDHGGYWDSFAILARLTEELGEVASALQRTAGLRPRKAEVDLASEVGDLLFTLAAFANAQRIDLDEAVRCTLEKYDVRDSAAWKEQVAKQ